MPAPGPVVHVWDTATGAEIVAVRGVGAASVAYLTPRANVLAVLDDFEVLHVYDLSTGRLAVLGWTYSVDWTPDGRTVITSSWDGRLQLWSL